MKLPYLHFLLDLGYFSIRTVLLYVSWYEPRGKTELIGLEIRLFRWTFSFFLYYPDMEVNVKKVSRWKCKLFHRQTKIRSDWDWGNVHIECSCGKRWRKLD